MVSLYSINGNELAQSLPHLEEDFNSFLFEVPDLKFNPLLNYDKAITIKESVYTFLINENEDDEILANQVRMYKDYIAISNSSKEVIIMGSYPDLGIKTSQNLKDYLNDSKLGLSSYLKQVTLSLFKERVFLQYILVLVQNTTYLFVISYLFLFISSRKPRLFSYRESLMMVSQSMFGPALISAFLGMFYPMMATLTFTILVIGRLIWIYQDVLNKRILFKM